MGSALTFGDIAAEAIENIGQKEPASAANNLKQSKSNSEIPSGGRIQCYVFDAQGCSQIAFSLSSVPFSGQLSLS
ncbi:hypothetical protein DSM3645_24075 [Blastopirellula marina DSM 3645]|uniref:Uncharacterized protein n=1 Tax=Blastopirellula marina DSM 3645 TaxID=314230 RepID=A3ZUQ6_9BACT|nr:hypothetical protein DSM3645_24075 [Blastopirellula marina DSM 3645]